MRTGEHRIGMLGLVGEAGTVPQTHEDDEFELSRDWGVSTIGPNGRMVVTPGNGPVRWIDASDRLRARLRIVEGQALIEVDGTLVGETSWPLYASVGGAVSHRVRRIVIDMRRTDVPPGGRACLRSAVAAAHRLGAVVDVVPAGPPAA